MTFKLLGIPEELRLAIEEASRETGYGKTSAITTEQARLVIETSVQEAEALVNKSLREIQSVIGPHGSISRLQSGGIRITPGTGIGVFVGGVQKTEIQPNGTFVIGSDITLPATTTEIFFVEDTVYNTEQFGAGDFLIGDNSSAQSNIKFDASEGQLQFRGGTTVQAYMDTDGSIRFGGGDGWLDEFGITFANQEGAIFFEDTNGSTDTVHININNDNWLKFSNSFGDRGMKFLIDDASHNVKQIDFDGDGNISLYHGYVNIPAGKSYNINGQPTEKGWFPVIETWTRTGNHTFTVPGDLTATYRKGTKVKYNDGSGEYGVVASSSHAGGTTTVTLITNTDYTMAAATITETYLSYIENPEGFPTKFNFTSTVTYAGGTTNPTSVTVNTAYWRVKHAEFYVTIQATLVKGAGDRLYTAFSIPVSAAEISPIPGMDTITAAGLSAATSCYFQTTNATYQRTMANNGDYYINGSAAF